MLSIDMLSVCLASLSFFRDMNSIAMKEWASIEPIS